MFVWLLILNLTLYWHRPIQPTSKCYLETWVIFSEEIQTVVAKLRNFHLRKVPRDDDAENDGDGDN